MNKKNISSGVLSLSVLQGFNFLLTLSVLPYLVHLFGATGWGRVVFVQMIINYLIWITNWGFYWGGTREVAKNRDQLFLTQKLFGIIWGAQWVLTFTIIILLLIIITFLPGTYENRDLYFAGVGLIIGSTLNPIWFFNGLEKIKEGAFLQILTKLLTMPGIFFLLHDESDLIVYFLINAVSSILVGVFSLFWLSNKKEIAWMPPHISEIKLILVSEFSWFKSSMIANLNSSLAPTVLGLLGGPTALGLYNLADRLRLAVITAINPISQAMFPRMSYLYTNNYQAAVYLFRKMGVLILILTTCLCLPLLIFPEEILSLIGGVDFKSAKHILIWLSMTPILSTLVSYILYQVIIPANESIGYSRAISITLIITLLLVFPFEYYFGAVGAGALIFLTELFTAIYLSLYIRKKKLFRVLNK